MDNGIAICPIPYTMELRENAKSVLADEMNEQYEPRKINDNIRAKTL